MTLPNITTSLPGPKAKALIERDAAVVSPSYTRGYPLVIKRASGASVEDVDGNMFLDCAAGIAVNSTGHSHPDVVRAITDQAQRFLHMSGTDFYYDVQVRLAEELAEMVPIDGGARSFFANSGTEAVEACIKLARYATGRPNIIAFFGGFHGRTMGSLALTASKPIQRRGFGPFMSGVFHAPYADCYRCPLGLTTGELRSRMSRFHRPPAVHAPHDAGGSGRHRHRADSRRGRVRRGARRNFSSDCASSPPSTAFCSLPTKCNPGWDAPGACLRSSTPT